MYICYIYIYIRYIIHIFVNYIYSYLFTVFIHVLFFSIMFYLYDVLYDYIFRTHPGSVARTFSSTLRMGLGRFLGHWLRLQPFRPTVVIPKLLQNEMDSW